MKKLFLKTLQYSPEKHLNWSLFLIKLQQLYLKQSPTQVLCCEHCDSSKNTYLEEHPRTAASDHICFTEKL